MGYEESREKKKKVLIVILVIMLFMVCATGVVYLVWNWYNNYMAQNIYDGLSQQYVSQVEEEEEDTPQLADNPVDFEALKKINSDVYAWVQMPGTVIDYPILQNEQDDYYLRRSIYKKYLLAGCIFSNDCNAKDFSDPVTLRDASVVSQRLGKIGVSSRLIINAFDYKLTKSKIFNNVDDIIDKSNLQLLGIVPRSQELSLLSVKHELKSSGKAMLSLTRIAKRILGENILLPKLKKI